MCAGSWAPGREEQVVFGCWRVTQRRRRSPASYVSLGGGKRHGGVRSENTKVQSLRARCFGPSQRFSNGTQIYTMLSVFSTSACPYLHQRAPVFHRKLVFQALLAPGCV